MTRINIMSLLGGICLSMILQITTVFAIECVGNNYEQVWPEIENTQIPSFKLDATYTDASERYANIKVSELVLDRQAIPSFRWCGYGLLFSDNINTLTETDNLQEVEVELKNQKAELIVRLGDGLGHLAIARITLTSDFDFNSITSTSPESITVSTTLNPTIVTPLAVINISGRPIYNTSESVTSGTVTISTSENSWTTSLDSSGKYNRDIDAPANSENINIEVSDGSLSGSVQSFLTVQNENDVPTQCEPANLKITEEAFDRNHPLRACLRFEQEASIPYTKVVWNWGDGKTEESTVPLGKRICHDYSYHPLNDVFRGSVEATKTDGRCFSDTFLAHVYEVELNGEIHLVETNPINFLPYVVGSGQFLPPCEGGAISFMGGDPITIYAPILTGKDANRFKVFLDGQSNQSVILENSLDSIDLEICPLESTTLGNFEATVSIATTAVNQPLIEIPVSIRFISEDEADGDKPDLKLTQPTGNLGQIETSATSIVLVGTVQDASTIRELICETQNNRVEVEIDHTIKGKSIAWTTPAIPLVPGDNKLKCMATDEFSRSSSVHLTATRKTNLPNIRVEPVDGESSFHFVGYEGTGYFPRVKQYTLTNTSDRTINWSISGSHYLEIYPFFGRTLAPGAKTTIDIVVNPNVTRDFLTDGYHNIEIILKEQGTPATLKLEGTLNKFVDIQRQNYRFYPARGSEWKQAFYSLARAPDGGYLFGGTERGSSWECSIMRVNHEGIPIWQRYYGDTSYRDVNTILRVGIEEFVFTCENSVIKIDDKGNILWKLPFEAQDGNQFKIKSITKMENSNDLIVAGEWFAVPDAGSEPSNKKLSVVRLASDGNVVWQKRLDPDNSVEVNHVTSTSDDGFFIVGAIIAFPDCIRYNC
ncbi:MAG: hypothetical protein VSS75_004180 [Candidatus Parabeggiatoa sp.]|nr:hypothetical protein [Candidatus Parabeggiatoa sp.]